MMLMGISLPADQATCRADLPAAANSGRLARLGDRALIIRSQRFAALIIGLALAAAPAHAADFLKAIDDVPLAQGLTEAPEPLIFETAQGRVVKTQATGQVDGGAVTSFYLETLPALGWKRVEADNALVFERENERLAIVIAEPRSSRPVEVTFELIVKLASAKLPE
jgi:hypothetical protein